MKISWPETRLIENKLMNRLPGGENLIHEAKMILQPEYAEAFSWQKKTYPIIKKYGQNKLRAEIDEVFHELFSHQSFRSKILKLFTRG